MPRKNRALGACALLAAVTIIAYLPALRAGFVWDDGAFLTDNPLIKAADGLRRFWFTTQPLDYWPVTSTTLWVEWRLWGMHALGYHATNLALHLAGCLLLWAVLRRLAIPGAFFAAILFAVHPVNAASVVWIAERKNLMAMLFYLASIWFYLKAGFGNEPTKGWRLPLRSGSRQPFVSKWHGLSLVAFILALLSKGSVVFLPVVLLGIILWHRRPNARDAALLAPFVLVGGALALVDVWFQGHDWRHAVSGAGGLERILKGGAQVWSYLFRAVAPVNLMFVYPEWHVRAGDPRWWAPLLAALAVTALLWRFRRGWGRPWLFAWGYFCVALAPALGFTNIGFLQFTPVADHYEHLALIGAVTMAAGVEARWRELSSAQTAGGNWRRLIPGWAAVAVVGCLMAITWKQCLKFRDARTLYEVVLQENPGAWLAHNNLGLLLYNEGKVKEAGAHFEAALRLNPDCAEAHDNLGMIYSDAGNYAEAIAQDEAALRLRPAYPEALNNLGNALRRTGREPEAIADYKQALRLWPVMAPAENGLGLALAATGRGPEAIAHYRRALQLEPDFFQAHHNLGLALADEGLLAEATGQFEEALRLQPDNADAHFDLGLALAHQGRLPEAIPQFEQAVRLRPDDALAHDNLGVALAKVGRVAEAIGHLEAATRLKPDDADARANLQALLRLSGKN